MEIWNWIKENLGVLSAGIMGLIVVAETITSLTKTEKDDKAVSLIKGWILKLGSFLPKKEVKSDSEDSSSDK